MTKVRTRSNSASASVPVSKQVKIQFQFNGADLGEKGTADVVNFVIASGGTVTRVGDTITVTITGGGGGAITSGQGTTANGTAVDWGGIISGDVEIVPDVDGSHHIYIGMDAGESAFVDQVTIAAATRVRIPITLRLDQLGGGGAKSLVINNNGDVSTEGLKQPLDADLTAIAALSSAADKLPYATGAQAWALTDLSSFIRTLLDDANAAAARATLGIVGDTFALTISGLSFNPADATTYYFGGLGVNVFAPDTTATRHDFVTPNFAFTIIGAIIQAGLNSTQGSGESSTMQLRNLTAATSSSIGTFVTNGTTTDMACTTIDGLSIAVPASQAICMQVDTASWATNPVSVRLSVTLICTVP